MIAAVLHRNRRYSHSRAETTCAQHWHRTGGRSEPSNRIDSPQVGVELVAVFYEMINMIKVGHIKKDKGIRVDTWSGSPLGNPYYKEPRETSIPKYRRWLWEKMQDPGSAQSEALQTLIRLYKQTGELTLLCWCAPKRCHAEVIKAALEWMISNEDVMIKIEGKSFRCECGCNVFKHNPRNINKFICNSCGTTYTGEW